MADSAVEPVEGVGEGPFLLEEPAVIGVVGGFDGVEFAEDAGAVVFALAFEGGEETGALADEDAFAGLADSFEHFAPAGEVVEEGLGADDVFAGRDGLDDVFGVEVVGGVDADDVDFLDF